MRTERKDVEDTKEREVCAVDCDGKDTALVDEEQVAFLHFLLFTEATYDTLYIERQRRAVQCTDLGLHQKRHFSLRTSPDRPAIKRPSFFS